MKLTAPSVFPRYDGYCFANLPATVQYWLTGQGTPALAPELMQGFTQQYDRVILLFIDSFGWQFVERYADEYPFLQRFARHGTSRQNYLAIPLYNRRACHLHSYRTARRQERRVRMAGTMNRRSTRSSCRCYFRTLVSIAATR